MEIAFLCYRRGCQTRVSATAHCNGVQREWEDSVATGVSKVKSSVMPVELVIIVVRHRVISRQDLYAGACLCSVTTRRRRVFIISVAID